MIIIVVVPSRSTHDLDAFIYININMFCRVFKGVHTRTNLFEIEWAILAKLTHGTLLL